MVRSSLKSQQKGKVYMKKRVQIMLSSEADSILRKLSQEEMRSISSIVELAVKAYAASKKGKT